MAFDNSGGNWAQEELAREKANKGQTNLHKPSEAPQKIVRAARAVGRFGTDTAGLLFFSIKGFIISWAVIAIAVDFLMIRFLRIVLGGDARVLCNGIVLIVWLVVFLRLRRRWQAQR